MKPLWRPSIDQWIPESQDISNMASRGISYQYMPPAEGAPATSESEEEKLKVSVAGHGKMSLNDVKTKLSDYFKQCETLVTTDNIKDLEKLEHLMNNPDAMNMIKTLVNHVKTLKSKAS